VKVATIGQAVTLATSVNPEGIAVDGTSVYWLEAASSSSNQQPGDHYPPGALMKMPLGGGTPEVLATPTGNQASFSGKYGPNLALDATNVYWAWGLVGGTPGATGSAWVLGSVMKVPLGGGTPVALATGQDALTAIAVGGSHVYWTTASSLMSVPIDGGTSVEVASWKAGAVAGDGMVVDGTSVYWTASTQPLDQLSLMKVPAAGGKATSLGTLLFPQIAVHDGYVYGHASEAGSGAAMARVPVAGGAPTPLVREQQSGSGFGPIAVDSKNLYWIGSNGAVLSTPLAGGPVTTLVAGPANDLVVTPTHLYWGHAYNSLDGAPGVLMSAPLL
jgi:hypothetical protein